jgi:hypothetical protein
LIRHTRFGVLGQVLFAQGAVEKFPVIRRESERNEEPSLEPPNRMLAR